MSTLLLVPLCQLTEDLVLVGNKFCKCLVGLRFVFLVFMFLGGGHCLLGRLGYFPLCPFFCCWRLWLQLPAQGMGIAYVSYVFSWAVSPASWTAQPLLRRCRRWPHVSCSWQQTIRWVAFCSSLLCCLMVHCLGRSPLLRPEGLADIWFFVLASPEGDYYERLVNMVASSELHRH